LFLDISHILSLLYSLIFLKDFIDLPKKNSLYLKPMNNNITFKDVFWLWTILLFHSILLNQNLSKIYLFYLRLFHQFYPVKENEKLIKRKEN
jgi:hypothetical protein